MASRKSSVRGSSTTHALRADPRTARDIAIQTGFVDEPRQAVSEADALVAEVIKRLAEIFADERQQLESRWERTENVSTEELRQAMQRYRSFFERLLAVRPLPRKFSLTTTN